MFSSATHTPIVVAWTEIHSKCPEARPLDVYFKHNSHAQSILILMLNTVQETTNCTKIADGALSARTTDTQKNCMESHEDILTLVVKKTTKYDKVVDRIRRQSKFGTDCTHELQCKLVVTQPELRDYGRYMRRHGREDSPVSFIGLKCTPSRGRQETAAANVLIRLRRAEHRTFSVSQDTKHV